MLSLCVIKLFKLSFKMEAFFINIIIRNNIGNYFLSTFLYLQ